MVLDKNLSVLELEHLMTTSADYVDLMKFGWCTSAVLPRDVIRRKCEILRAHAVDICPGGTLVELAYLQGSVPQLLKEARELGFTCIEVSDGTVPMAEEAKLDTIKRALDAGFRVVSEVGSKFVAEDHRLGVAARLDSTHRELEAGVWKVIVEARESGTAGIFDKSGTTQGDMLTDLLKGVASDDLIIEAPMKQQQADMILRLGSDVNLGNIPPQEIVALETLRLGLRGDTMRHFHMSLPTVTLELGASGAARASKRGDVIIIVDAIRASTTIITALANGIKTVRPVATPEECIGDVTAGERGGQKLPDANEDNSPLAFRSPKYAGRNLVLTTSNGTECILSAAANPRAVVLVGALVNCRAVASYGMEVARETGRGVSIVVAGRNNQLAREDVIAASEIAFNMRGAPVAGEINLVSSDDLVVDFLSSDSGINVSQRGHSDDVVFCATKDVYDTVPIFHEGLLTVASAGTSS
jgi:2-phosphosulfolactate phosphatase